METIVLCEIGPYPKSFTDPLPKVTVTLSSGEVKELFSFYPDEISFSANEFIGLTVEEAVALRCKKDVEFLQS